MNMSREYLLGFLNTASASGINAYSLVKKANFLADWYTKWLTRRYRSNGGLAPAADPNWAFKGRSNGYSGVSSWDDIKKIRQTGNQNAVATAGQTSVTCNK